MIFMLVRFRKLVQVGVIVLCIVGGARGRANAERIAPFARKDSLPIVDVHGHLNGDMSAEQLIDLMDRSGVSRMVLMPRYFSRRRSGGSGSDEQALEYAKSYPGRFIPFVAGQRDMLNDRGRWLNPDRQAENLLREIETELRTQQFYGIGELIIRHYAFEGRQRGIERDIPVNTPLMGRFADLAARYEVPLLIHAEGEPEVVAGMKQILEKYPKTRIIWAHNCGRSSPEIIRAMLTGYLNLTCDLGGMLNAPFSP
jgi:predicted TIM-barrel fold metal-dependent hydrolase